MHPRATRCTLVPKSSFPTLSPEVSGSPLRSLMASDSTHQHSLVVESEAGLNHRDYSLT
jgi:hypothetical protein